MVKLRKNQKSRENTMTKLSKTVILISICCVLCICAGFFWTNMYAEKQYKNEIAKKEPVQKKNKEDIPEAKSVSVDNSPTEKYILKYNKETDTVYLVTQKTDGTRIISPVESIKPFYLTAEDISALTSGIELTSREDMFILIEDFSS